MLVPDTIFGSGIDPIPLFVIPGLALAVVGAGLLAVVVIRSGVLPRWAGYSLLIGAGMLLLANEQTAAVLFAVPFGIALLLVGAALWRGSRNAVLGLRIELAHVEVSRAESKAEPDCAALSKRRMSRRRRAHH